MWRVRRDPGSKIKASVKPCAGDSMLCIHFRDDGRNWQMCIVLTGVVLPRLWRLTPPPIRTEYFRVMTEFGDVCAKLCHLPDDGFQGFSCTPTICSFKSMGV